MMKITNTRLLYAEKDLYGRYTPVVLINSKLIPNNINIIAHILSHEWGHHVLRHMELEPPTNYKTEDINEIKKKKMRLIYMPLTLLKNTHTM